MAGYMKISVPAGLAALLLAACSPQQETPPGADTPAPGSMAVTSDVPWFEEQEPGVAAYPVRVLVGAAHVRIDTTGMTVITSCSSGSLRRARP